MELWNCGIVEFSSSSRGPTFPVADRLEFSKRAISEPHPANHTSLASWQPSCLASNAVRTEAERSRLLAGDNILEARRGQQKAREGVDDQ